MKNYNSRIVIYKTLSISFVIFLLVAFVVYLFFVRESSIEEESLSKEGIVIRNTVLEGEDQNGKSYTITSELVHKESDDYLYYLDILSGVYNIGNIELAMVANKGVMNDRDKTLLLKQSINLDYLGYKVKTEKLEINLRDMSAKSQDAVDILYQNSNISADSFEIDTNNNQIHLYGNIKTYIKISDFK